MAYDVEDKVVQMRFDNREFDPNIDASINSLKKLEKSLQLANGTSGLDNINKSAKNFDLNPAITAVESLKKGFSTMEIVAINVISNITNKAQAMVEKIVDAFAIAPLRSGMAEYTEQMNSTQVIQSNTHESIENITYALNELNEYADRTIYSFGQMTQAIGKFSAAGVNLKDSVAGIKGLSSAAATVGATNQQLFSAYYNLAQSLQLGYVPLIDWKSLENSTIGNKTMREAFIKTAIAMNKFSESSDIAKKAYSDFRGSLQEKWLTSDVVLKTLEKYSRAIKKNGDAYYDWNEETRTYGDALTEIKDATGKITGYISTAYGKMEAWEVELADTAYKAATEVKSFAQMWDVLTEAAGTGWADTWKIILGNLEQSKDLWTDISESIESVISKWTNLRQAALNAWAAFGGRDDLVAGLKSLARTFSNIGQTLAETFAILTGSSTKANEEGAKNATSAGKTLARATRSFRLFAEALEKTTDRIDEIAPKLAKLLTPLKWIGNAISFIIKVALSAIVIAQAIVKTIIRLLANLKDVPLLIDEIFGSGSWNVFLNFLSDLLVPLKFIYSISRLLIVFIINISKAFWELINTNDYAKNILESLGIVLKTISRIFINLLSAMTDGINNLTDWIKNGKLLSTVLEKFGKIAASDFVSGITKGLGEGIKKISDGAKDLAGVLINTFRGPEGIDAHSPSKVGIILGGFFVLGIAAGILANLDKIKEASKLLSNNLIKNTSYDMSEIIPVIPKEGIGNAEKGISKFGKVFDKLKTKFDTFKNKAEEVFGYIGSGFVNLAKKIEEFTGGITLSKFLVISFSASIIALIFSITSMFMKLGNSLIKLTSGVPNALNALANFGNAMANNINAKNKKIWSESFRVIADGIFEISKAIALLAIISKWNPEGLRNAAIVLGMFATAITVLIFAFGILINKLEALNSIGNAKKAIQNLIGIARASVKLLTTSSIIIAVTLSILMLTKSLEALSNIETAPLFRGLAVIGILMATITGMIILLSKFAPQLTRGTLMVFAFSYATNLFAKALANIGGNLGDGIQKLTNMGWDSAAKLILLIGALAAMSVFVNRASTAITKTIMALTWFSIGLGLMNLLIGIIKENPLAYQLLDLGNKIVDYIKSTDFVVHTLAILGTLFVMFMIVLTSFTLIINLTDIKRLTLVMDHIEELSTLLKSMGTTFLSFIGGLVILMVSISLMRKILDDDQFISAIISVGAIFIIITAAISGMLIGITALAMTIKKNNIKGYTIFDKFAGILKALSSSMISMALSMGLIIGIMSLFWKQYDDPAQGWAVLASAIVVIGALAGIVSGMLAVVGRNYKNDGSGILKVMIPTLLMIAELFTSLMLLTAIIKDDPKSVFLAVMALQGIIGPIIALFSQFNKLVTTGVKTSTLASGSSTEIVTNLDGMFKMLVTILAGIAVLLGEVAALSIIFNNRSLTSVESISAGIATFLFTMGLVLAMIERLTTFIDKLGQMSNPHHAVEGLKQLSLIIVAISGLVLAIGVVSFASKEWTDILVIAAVAGAIYGAIRAIDFLIKELGNRTISADKLIAIGSLFGIFAGVAASLGAVIYLLKDIPVGNVVGEIAILTAAIAAMGGIIFLLSKFGDMNNGDALIKAGAAMAIMAGAISVLALSIGVMSWIVSKTDSTVIDKVTTIMTKFMSLASRVILLTGLISKIGTNSNNESVFGQLGLSFGGQNKSQIGAVGLVMIDIAKSLLILAGALWVISTIPTDKVENVISMMTAMSIALGILTIASGLISLFAKDIKSVTSGMIMISGAMLMIAGAMFTLSLVPADKVTQVIKTMAIMTGVLAGLSMLAVGISNLNQYALLGAAVIAVIGASMIAGAYAISILSNAPLEELSEKLKTFSDDSVIKGMWAFVGAFSALAIGLTLGGPGIIFASAAILALSLALTAINSVLITLSNVVDPLLILINAAQNLKNIIKPLAAILGIITLFSPAIIIIGLIVSLALGMIGVVVKGIASLANAISLATQVVVPFVQALANAGNIIINNLTAFWALAGAVLGFGTVLLIIAPGILAIAAAISLVAVSLGVALGLATPIVLAIGLVLDGLLLVILAMKDAVIELFDTVIRSLPKIVELVNNINVDAESFMIISKAFMLFGIALALIGAGGVLAAIGILALTGALVVMSKAMKTISGPTATLESFFRSLTEQKGNIAGLGGVFAVLGLGLLILGVGSLAASIGLLALTGVAALIGHLFGGVNNVIDELYKRGGKVAAIGAAFIALGAGLAVLGAGLIVLTFPIVILGVAFTIFASVLALVASVCVTILAPAISIIALALAPLVMAITMCINAVTGLTTAFTQLLETGSLSQVGVGLLLVSAGFAALALVSVLILPVIPIMLLVVSVMTLVSQIMYTVTDAIVYFTNGLHKASISISMSLITISSAFMITCQNIADGIRSIIALASEGASAASDFVGGFVHTIGGGISNIVKSTVTAGAAAVEGFRSKDAIDSHSDSKKMKEVAKDTIGGFVHTIQNGEGDFFDAMKNAGKAAIDGFKETGIGSVVSSVSDVVTGKKGIGDVVGDVSEKYFGEGSALDVIKDTLAGIWNKDTGSLDLSKIFGLDGDAAEEAASGIDDYANSLDSASSSVSNAKGTIESLTDTIKNQMKIFERFTYDEEIMNPKELINNMKSQLRGIQNWANGIDMLAVRGMSGPLLQYLSEMGPEGYKYVEAFLEMTESEFAEANELYAQSLNLPESAANQIGDSYRRVGLDIVEGVNSGYSSAGGVSEPADDMTSTAQNTAEEVYNIAETGAKATLEMLAKMYSEGGVNAKWAFIEELNEWKSMADYQNWINDAVRNRDYDKLQMKVDFVSGGQMLSELNDIGIESSNIIGQASMKEFERNEDKFRKSIGTYYVNGMNLTGTQYADLCIKEQKQLMAVFIEDGFQPKENADNIVTETVEEANKRLEAEKSKVIDETSTVGDEAANGTTTAYEKAIEEWLDSELPGLGVTWREKIANEFMQFDENWIASMGGSDAALKNYTEKMYKTHIQDGMKLISLEQQKYWRQSKGGFLFKYIVNGIEKEAYTGTYLDDCRKAGYMIGAEIENGTKDALGIASPSKEYAEIARFSILGFVDGIMRNIKLAESASEQLGDSTLDSLSSTIQAISSQFTEDLDTTPTIRPVLDLTDVYAGAQGIDALFSTQQATIAAQAYSIPKRDTVKDMADSMEAQNAKQMQQLADIMMTSDQPVNITVTLNGGAEQFFDYVVDRNRQEVLTKGNSPLMIARRNSINAGLV